jgi:lambda family phage minor tail protein L
MSIPQTEVQTLTPGSKVILYDLDATMIPGGGTYHFATEMNQVGGGVIFGGVTYQPLPIAASGFEMTTQGALPHPKLQTSNLDGVVGSLVRALGDLTGAILTRREVLVKFLDAANFISGTNPTANSAAAYRPEIWVIEQKTSEDNVSLEFDLVASCDAQGLKVPSRIIQTNGCGWEYKKTECGYAGSKATCAKLLTSSTGDGGCQEHKADGGASFSGGLPFGAFPGAVL